MWERLTQGQSVTFEMRWRRSAANADAGIPEFDFVWMFVYLLLSENQMPNFQ